MAEKVGRLLLPSGERGSFVVLGAFDSASHTVSPRLGGGVADRGGLRPHWTQAPGRRSRHGGPAVEVKWRRARPTHLI